MRDFVWMRRAGFFALSVFVFSVAGIACDEGIREKSAYLSGLEDQIEIAESENSELRLCYAELSSPRRLAEVAENELGMVKSTAGDIVFYAEEDEARDTDAEPFEGGGIFGVAERWFAR